MGKTKTVATCEVCGHTEPKWLGHCPGCGAWGSMREEPAEAARAGKAATAVAAATETSEAVPIGEVAADERGRFCTGVGELDRVLGGGLVPGSVALVAGEPGAGKSTLLLQAADALAGAGHDVLYVTAEESPSQVRLRADRLGTLSPRLWLASATSAEEVLALAQRHAPAVLVVDSVQTLRDEQAGGVAGGAGQVRAVAAAITAAAKASGFAAVVVGHVTKEGSVAGPRALEHLVDAVLELGGDRHHALRLLRASKNRFGAVGEVGCFEMTGYGLTGVDDPGRLFGGSVEVGTPGVARTVTVEGHRPLRCEVQALAAPTSLAQPRRVASGVDANRLTLLLAVLQRRADVPVTEQDVYAASVGGLRLTEPAVDLAVCCAVASSHTDRPVKDGLVAVGEVGLAGELRAVARTADRLSEAARTGAREAVVPAAYDGPDAGLVLTPSRTVRDGLDAALSPGP